MNKIKIGVIKETKIPIDKRVPLTPSGVKKVLKLYPDIQLYVEPSNIRCYSDEDYGQILEKTNFITEDDVEIFLGVKEVDISKIIKGKTYLFFSHTIKKQPYNQKLLQECSKKKVTLIDYEVIKDPVANKRLIGFGEIAGIIGAFNSLKAYSDIWLGRKLKPAYNFSNVEDLINEFNKSNIQALKLLLTGKGSVGKGAKDFLKKCGFEEVSLPEYLNVNPEKGLFFCNVDYNDYYKDNISILQEFLFDTDILITGHYYDYRAPVILPKSSFKKLKALKVVGDISCDIDGPVGCTVRSTSIEEPTFIFDKLKGIETENLNGSSLIVMAVDNLPCEMPKLSSDMFSEKIVEIIIPELFKTNSEILANATILKKGILTNNFYYLNDYLNHELIK